MTSLLCVALLGAGDPSPEAVRAAVRRALPPLQRSAREYTRHRECFSCHHQTLPILAMTAARARGFDVDEDVLRGQTAFTVRSLEEGKRDYLEGSGQGGKASTASFALRALEAAGREPDALTDAVATYLVGLYEEKGRWRLTSRRPPSGASEFTTAAFSARALKAYGPEGERARIERRLGKVRKWLIFTKPRDTEDRVFRMRGLATVGAKEEAAKAAAGLLSLQRDDGGWAQREAMESDAYATGTALVALYDVGALAHDAPAYRRGLKFLLSRQAEDGTWHVETRANGFQKYFESGFPYGKDQFISISASAWATAALAIGAEEEGK